MIIGSAGSGKSTLARQLGAETGLPIIHLDRAFWNADWIETPDAEWSEKQKQLLSGTEWIVDGNYGGTLEIRLEKADTLIFLDFNRYICLYRAIKRWLTHLGKTRPDMADACPEKMDWEFIRYIWRFPVVIRPIILKKMADYKDLSVVVLKNRKEVRDFLENICNNI